MNEKVIASEARLAVKLIYGFALTAVGIMAVFIVEANFLKVLAQRGLLDVVYKLSVLVLVFPLIFPVTLLFRLKFMLIKNYKNRFGGKVWVKPN